MIRSPTSFSSASMTRPELPMGTLCSRYPTGRALSPPPRTCQGNRCSSGRTALCATSSAPRGYHRRCPRPSSHVCPGRAHVAAVINRQQLLKIYASWKLSCKSMPIKTPLPLTKPCRIPFAALFSNYGRCALDKMQHATTPPDHSSKSATAHATATLTDRPTDPTVLHTTLKISLLYTHTSAYTQNRPACTLKNRSVVSRRTSSSRPQVLEVGLSLRSLRSVIEVSH